MATLTYEQLVEIGACKQREEFKEMFKGVMNLTPDIAEQYATRFDTKLSIHRILTPDELKEYGRRLHEAVKGQGLDQTELKRLKARIATEIYCARS